MADSAHICAIVVTYFPDSAALAALVDRLQASCRWVLIVDNGSPTGTLPAWPILAADELPTTPVSLLSLGDNYGIAHAQNTGIALAQRLAASHVLLSDQDSLPAIDMVARLLAAEATLQATGERIGLLAPVFDCEPARPDQESRAGGQFLKLQDGRFRRLRCPDGALLAVDMAIASGSLIPLPVLAEVGGMDAGLFIDAVDTEWCLRARARQFAIYVVGNARLAHRLGHGTRRIWLPGGWRRIPLHSPRRSYTIVRNNLILCRMPHVPGAWRHYVLGMLLRRAGYFMICGPQRWAQLRALWRGLCDGLAGKHGRPPF